MIFLCRIGSSRNTGSRSSAARWFSTVQPTVTFSYPSPQSAGTQSMNRTIRFVRNKKCRSARSRIILQQSSLHASASSRRKSERKHKYTGPPGRIRYSPFFVLPNGRVELRRFYDRFRVDAAPCLAFMNITIPAAVAVPMAAAPWIPSRHLPVPPNPFFIGSCAYCKQVFGSRSVRAFLCML